MSPLHRFVCCSVSALSLLLTGFSLRAQVPEPPLPGTDGDAEVVHEAFSPLLEPGMVPPPGNMNPAPAELSSPLLPPSADFPELPPATAAERDLNLENIPGLNLQEDDSALPPIPGETPVTPAAPGADGTPGPASSGQPIRAKWLRNPREARQLAIDQKKPLLLFFSSASTEKEFVFDGKTVPNPTRLIRDDLTSQPLFNEFAAEHLILCSLHYPVGVTAPLYEPERGRFLALMKFKDYFKAKLPSLILLDHNGRELERIQGYSRVKNAAGKQYSSGMVLLDRLKTATKRHSDNVKRAQERLDSLTAQGYRVWKSRAGTELMAKLYSATPQLITVMDENGRLRRSRPVQLSLLDCEWVRRKQAGLIPPPGAARPASASVPQTPSSEVVEEISPAMLENSHPPASRTGILPRSLSGQSQPVRGQVNPIE